MNWRTRKSMTDEAVRKTEEKKTPALETETSSLFSVWSVILFPKMYKTLSISGSPEMFFSTPCTLARKRK